MRSECYSKLGEQRELTISQKTTNDLRTLNTTCEAVGLASYPVAAEKILAYQASCMDQVFEGHDRQRLAVAALKYVGDEAYSQKYEKVDQTISNFSVSKKLSGSAGSAE
jgi:hypothetical protein